jgi:dTDP-4-dehydrorhamnose reductase
MSNVSVLLTGDVPEGAGKVAARRKGCAVETLLERVLLVGGSGQIGREIAAALGGVATAPSHAELDLEQHAAVEAAVAAVRPTLVVNAAAYHHVDRCEEHPERAFAVNALAVDHLAGACARHGAAFATFSTDYVFDGAAREPYREGDQANPLSAYGASKLAGEHLVRRHGERHIIVRTSGVYGRVPSSSKGYTFIDRVLQQAEAGEPVRVVADVTFSPSYAPHVAAAFLELARRGAFGTYHVTNAGATTWHGFAAAAFAARGLPPPDPVPQSTFPTIARRPMYSALAHEALAKAGLPPMPPWKDALHEYLATRAPRDVAS